MTRDWARAAGQSIRSIWFSNKPCCGETAGVLMLSVEKERQPQRPFYWLWILPSAGLDGRQPGGSGCVVVFQQ